MMRIGMYSKGTVVPDDDEERAVRHVSYGPPVVLEEISHSKKNQRKKRQRNSWKNGGRGAVNPKWIRGFLRTTQLSGSSGRHRRIDEIPFFRDRLSSNPSAEDAKNLKRPPALVTAIFLLRVTRRGPNKRIQASSQTSVRPVGVNPGPFALAPALSVRGSMPGQPAADCSVPQQRSWGMILLTGPLVRSVIAPLLALQRQQPELPLLIRAIVNHDHELLKQLLSCPGIDVNARDIDGLTGLHHAALQLDLEAMKQLLADPRVDPNIQDHWGNTAFAIAVKKNSMELVSLLLSRLEMDPNLPNYWGETPVLKALESGNVELLVLLLTDQRVNLGWLDGFSLVDSKKCGIYELETSDCPSIEQAISSIPDSREYSLSPEGQLNKFSHSGTDSAMLPLSLTDH